MKNSGILNVMTNNSIKAEWAQAQVLETTLSDSLLFICQEC